MTNDKRAKLNMVHDPLDELLKADAGEHRAHHIDDAGFTLRVMDTLPVRATVSPMIRYGLPFGMAVLAALITALFTPAGNFVIDATMDIVTQTPTRNAIAMVVLLMVMVGVGVVSAGNDN